MAEVYSLANTILQQVSTNFNTSAPKAGQNVYGNLLKLSDYKCLLWNDLARPSQPLLNPVALECFDSYKIDYSEENFCDMNRGSSRKG
jgi:hypothetical protein